MKSPITQRLSPLEEVVLLTVSYTDQFDHPLTENEILTRCLLPHKLKLATVSKSKEIADTLSQLKRKKLLDDSQGFYFLPEREAIVHRRLQREIWAKERDADVRKVVSYCQKIPWIQAVYVTGSLAMRSVDPNSDIDFMLIIQPKRLWLTRIFVSLFAQLHGKRRSWNHEEPASWCFNLWLDSEHLKVGESYQDIYRAYEVIQANPVFQKNYVKESFFSENNWINQFFFQNKKQEKNEVGESEELAGWTLIDGVDWFAWKAQSWYMKHHQTREKVGRGFAFFHPRDTRKIIYGSWQLSLERILPKKTATQILQKYVR